MSMCLSENEQAMVPPMGTVGRTEAHSRVTLSNAYVQYCHTPSNNGTQRTKPGS
jgi:hypothetical protein